ncbi:hypothetical protein HMPREF9944_01664, partial [Segatella maculosa OT 289]
QGGLKGYIQECLSGRTGRASLHAFARLVLSTILHINEAMIGM